MHHRIATESIAMSIEAPFLDKKVAAAPRRDMQHVLVPPAMLVAAVAMALASHLHLGFSIEVALAIGISLFCVMLMSHVLLRAAHDADRAEEEAFERRVEKVSSPMPPEPQPVPEAAGPLLHPTTSFEALVAPSAMHAEQAPLPSPEPTAAAAVMPPPVAAAAPSAAPELSPFAAVLAKPETWAFRPGDFKHPFELPAEQPKAETALPELGQLRPTFAEHGDATASEQPAKSREADRIDAILKRLASQIHANAAERRSTEPPSSSAAAQPAEAPAAVAPEPIEKLAAEDPDSALSSAVDALRSTVEAMRGAAQAGPSTSAEPKTPASPVEVRIAAVAEALAAERADVFLSPILGLGDEQARHFEVSVQLRSEDGEVLPARDVATSSGLLPLLDALNVRHAAGFALKLERRGRDGSVFSRVGGVSLEDDHFVQNVAGRHAQGIADRMVLSFAQDEMRGLGPAQLAALGDLGRLGFRFALQGVSDLDMDFEALNALGFEFVKLDAAVFQEGLACNGAHVPAADICSHFEDLGLAVIVSGIADGATRDRMLGCGVVFGQGALFGKPMPVPVSVETGTMAA